MGIGDEWDFDYPIQYVQTGWLIMEMTGHVPHHLDVLDYDPRWISDLNLMSRLNRWINPPKKTEMQS